MLTNRDLISTVNLNITNFAWLYGSVTKTNFSVIFPGKKSIPDFQGREKSIIFTNESYSHDNLETDYTLYKLLMILKEIVVRNFKNFTVWRPNCAFGSEKVGHLFLEQTVMWSSNVDFKQTFASMLEVTLQNTDLNNSQTFGKHNCDLTISQRCCLLHTS